MKTLAAPTEQFIKKEVTYLTADVTAGSDVSLAVENTDGFAQYSYVAIGYEGNELCELQQVNAAISGNTSMQVATVKFAHKKGEPITLYRYNQRKFYGATSETGTYTELTSDGSPVDIQVDDPQGTVLEYSGSTYTYFKSTYYNSQTSEETSTSDSEAVEGDETLRYSTLYAIRKHAGLLGNRFYSDIRLETKRKQAESEINSALYSRYTLPLAEVPALITQICELLAAGYIDFEEFGKDGEGVKWLGEARALLKAITSGKQMLIGADGTELARRESTGRLSGFPIESTAGSDSGERIFTIDQDF